VPLVAHVLCLYNMTLIPDGISSTALSTLMEDAPTDDINKQGYPFAGHSQAELITAAEIASNMLIQEIPHPVAHKVLALMVISNLINWHNKAAESLLEESPDAALAWSEDVGILKSTYRSLLAVEVTQDDFTYDEGNDVCTCDH